MANLYSWVIPALLHAHIVMPLIILLLFCHFTTILEIQLTNPTPVPSFSSAPLQYLFNTAKLQFVLLYGAYLIRLDP